MLTFLTRDWKKLTFYYFADSYINFNSLVTDLFKVYKTRIWMSAMNPASFAHPAGIHPPGSGLPGSGALGAIGESTEQPTQMMHQPQYSGLNPSYTSYMHSTGPNSSMVPHRGQQMAVPGFPPRHSPHTSIAPHQDFSHLPQQQLNGYNAPYMNGNSNGHHGQGHIGNNLENHSTNGSDAWMSLQGLSLNSH